MWHTPQGDRTLCGPEAELFRHGLLAMARRNDHRIHRGYFSRLTARERLVALAHVARALLDGLEPAPDLHAWNEAAIYAVYCFLRHDAQRSPKTRRLVASVCGQHHLYDGCRADPSSMMHDPDFCLEALADLILWDHDWELEDEMHDVEEFNGYFVAPPVATPQRVEQALEYLRALEATAVLGANPNP